MKRLSMLTTFALCVTALCVLAFGLGFPAVTRGLGSAPPAPNCSERSLRGWYGFSMSGTFPVAVPSSTPPLKAELLAIVGKINFDGVGGTTFYSTINHEGAVGEPTYTPSGAPVTARGTYTMRSDCTGSMTVPPGGIPVPVRFNFVSVDNGKELLLIMAAPALPLTGPPPPLPLGGVVTGVAKQE
jgi:hypothetical protein